MVDYLFSCSGLNKDLILLIYVQFCETCREKKVINN